MSESGRLVSLDVFRGMTIAGMIVVNNPGSWSTVYPPLLHAEWHGWTPTDLIFPFFLFIVGVSMSFSFSRRLEQRAPRSSLFRHVAVRSALLFILGMILTGFPDYYFYDKLILDVLQRIAVVYLLSAAIVLVTNELGQVIGGVGCLILYWVLMMLIPVPGYGSGVLEWEGSVWDYVDKLLLTGWHGHAEGILSLIPSVSTVLFGTLTGAWLRADRTPAEKACVMFVAGNVGLVVGLILDVWFPINKLLWSSSYVVFTAGFALNLLGVCYWLIDMKGWKKWATPFLVFGMNAIATFFLASFVARLMGLITVQGEVGIKTWIYRNLFESWLTGMNASLAFALVYTTVWLGIMYLFYRRRLFIKL